MASSSENHVGPGSAGGSPGPQGVEAYLAELHGAMEQERAGLQERVKELRCIYAVDRALHDPDGDWTSRLLRVAEAIPSGFRFPDLTVAAVRLGKESFRSSGFQSTEWSLRQPIAGLAGEGGEVEVCVLSEPPEGAGSAFLPEEEELIGAVAHRLGGAWRARTQADSLQLVNTALEAAHDGVVITDRDGVIRWVNPAFTRITGYGKEEAVGHTPGEILRSGVHDRTIYQHLWETILRGDVWRGRIVNRRKDGTLYTEEQTITPVLDASAGISHFIAIKSDVSRTVGVEEEQRRLLTVLDALPDFVGTADLSGRVIHINRGGRRMVGLGDEEAVRGREISDFHPPWAAEIVRQEGIGAAALASGSWSGETALLGPDGEEIPVWQRILVHRSESGEVEFLSTIARDLREEKRRLVQLRFQANLLDAVGQAVIATDLEGRVTYWNRAAEEIYGWTAEEAVGRSVMDLNVSEDSLSQATEAMKALRRGEDWTGEIDLRRKDGSTFRALVVDSPIRDATDRMTGVIGISSDVTEFRELEAQFRHAQKMEAVGRLAAGVAHDFNNLLTVIQGHMQLIMEEAPEDAPVREDLREVLGQVQRGATLTRQLLAFTRRQVLVERALGLAGAVEEMEPMLRRLIPERISLGLELDGAPHLISADPANLQQIVINLVVNALHSIPATGSITLRVDSRIMSSREAGEIPWHVSPGPYARLTVRDTGTGMTPEVLERIFEPFFTTKPEGEGTGLGLSMVFGTVKQSGGHIFVDSAPGEGATFQILFPPLEGEVGDGPETKETVPRKPSPDGEGTVLLVEDEPSLRDVTRRILERAGFSVIAAANGREALAAVEREGEGERIDVVVSDAVMPEMGGLELVDLLKKRRPDLGVVLMSGYTEAEMAGELRQKASAFLEKPFSPDDLTRLVREVLG